VRQAALAAVAGVFGRWGGHVTWIVVSHGASDWL
jgi:hypothetical protein